MAKYQYNGCGDIFDEAFGEEQEGYPPMPFAKLPAMQCSLQEKFRANGSARASRFMRNALCQLPHSRTVPAPLAPLLSVLPEHHP